MAKTKSLRARVLNACLSLVLAFGLLPALPSLAFADDEQPAIASVADIAADEGKDDNVLALLEGEDFEGEPAAEKISCDLYAFCGYLFLNLYSDAACTDCLGTISIKNLTGGFYTKEGLPQEGGGSTHAYIDLEPGTYYIKCASTAGKLAAAEPIEYVVDANAGGARWRSNFKFSVHTGNSMDSAQKAYQKEYGDDWEERFNAADFNYDGGLEIIPDSEGLEVENLRRSTSNAGEPVFEFSLVTRDAALLAATVRWVPQDNRFGSPELVVSSSRPNSTATTLALNPLIQPKRTFTVPSEYADAFTLYRKGGMHYTPFTELVPDSRTENGDGTTTFGYYLPLQTEVHYTIHNVGGNIKLSRKINFNVGTPDNVVVRGYSNVRDDYLTVWGGIASDNWTHYELDNSLRMNLRPMEDANVYLGFSGDKAEQSSHMMSAATGESFKLDSFRTWQAVTSTTGNYFVEPDFHYEVIGDSVTLAAAGEEGREYQTVTAAGSGVSVIKVTYDAMYFGDPGLAFESFFEGENARYYDAIAPENTGILIVDVDGKNTANISPNLKNPSTGYDLTEFDTIYFDRQAGSVDYRFTPTADAAMTVRVHDPLHSSQWGQAWTTYEGAADGSYTVNLKEGRNILEITAADGSRVYWVINARAVDVTVKNLTAEDGTFHLGDKVEVSIDGMYLPIQKMAAIYNPNYPANGWIEYKTADGQTHKSVGAQYNAVTAAQSKITYTITADCLDQSGKFVLSDGVIHNEHLGSGLGAHHSVPASGLAPNLNASAGANEPWFCALPQVSVAVSATVRQCADGKHYGEKEARGAIEATCTTPGWSGDAYCIRCGQKIADGEETPLAAHDYRIAYDFNDHWYVCDACGAEKDGSRARQTGSGGVRVIVENSTYSAEDGASWDGVLVDKYVSVNDGSTMMTAIRAALGANASEIRDGSYIVSIGDLGEFDGGEQSGWMGTLNGWFVNESFSKFGVGNGKLENGDVIVVSYTCKLGEDLGSSFDGNDKTLKGISFSKGQLDQEFSKDVHAYTLVVPEGTTSVMAQPTASNKNYQVHTTLDGTEYKPLASSGIPVADGSVITVTCGDPAWPTMNDNSGPAQVYTFAVEYDVPKFALAASIQVPDDLKVGDTFSVDVTATANKGVAAMSGVLDYDPDQLELVGVTKGAGLSEGASFLPAEGAAEAKFSFVDNEADAKGGIVAATATFKVKAAGDLSVGIVAEGDDAPMAAMSGDVLEYTVKVGPAATVTARADALLGDVNNNGKINIVDAQVVYDMSCGVYGQGYADYPLPAGWNMATLLWVANVNGDDGIDAVDAFAIQRFVHYGAWS